uniref:HVA22-like protein n=1 Tax=Bicosoecida sp. CB-2014 TaxID=1486930 RepID=A0A7S1G3Q7_9STRA|mmetsp:Transcript_11091/g.38611  ORF Transcript_11091/g.38611 Transcript_11091/m.38611 type:complete len:237 (+) Transcript_11091:270-980(+)
MVLLVLVDKVLTAAALLWGMYQSFKVLKLEHDDEREHHRGGGGAGAGAGVRAGDGDDDDEGGPGFGDDSEGVEVRRRGEEMLMYWVFFALLAIYDRYLEIFFYWLPFYYEAKVLFLVLFLVPYFGMPRYVFTTFLQPFMKTHVTRWVAEASPWVRTKLARFARLTQEAIFGLTRRSVPADELRQWEGSLRTQLAAARAERQRRMTGGAAEYLAASGAGKPGRRGRAASGGEDLGKK